MQKLDRAPADPIEVHKNTRTRIYMRTSQRKRIDNSREYLRKAIELCGENPSLCEIGCGAMDISGPFSSYLPVYGVECNENYAEVVKKRYPKAHFRALAVEEFEGLGCDVLVACEILEHLKDPRGVMKRLMPKTKYAVISHPLDEPVDYPDNEHSWSLSKRDFKKWFYDNGFRLLKAETFKQGCFVLIVGFGVRSKE